MVASGLETKTVSRKRNYLLPLATVGPLHFGLAPLHGPLPEGWLQMFLSTRSLDLAAIDMKLVAVN